MTHPDDFGGNVFAQIARELAAQADAEAADRHPQTARVCAELGLVYATFATHDPAGEHSDHAWQAAESARELLAQGAHLGAAADTARARLHLALAELPAATGEQR